MNNFLYAERYENTDSSHQVLSIPEKQSVISPLYSDTDISKFVLPWI